MAQVLQPSLRFPEFEGDWIETTFGSHYSFKTTNSFSREKLNYEEGEVKNIHYGDIHTTFNLLFDVAKEPVPFINLDEDISNIDEENYVQNGDIVIADASEDYADVGKSIEVVNMNDERILAGLHTFLARKEDDEVAEGFFAFLLTTYRARLGIMRIAQGTKVLGLSKDRFSEIPFLIPQPDEQQKIASFLKATDKRIQLLKDKKEALEDYKKSIMQKLFTQEIRFKQDDGSDFPEWQELKIGEIFEHRTERNNNEDNDNLLSVTQDRGVIEQSETSKPDISNSDKSNYKLVYKGDLVYNSMRMWQGASGVSEFNGIVSPAYTILKSKENFNPLFFGHLFKTKNMIHLFQRYSQGLTSDMWNLKYDKISQIKLNAPILGEQNKIAAYLIKIDEKINLISNKIIESENFKKYILQKMFV